MNPNATDYEETKWELPVAGPEWKQRTHQVKRARTTPSLVLNR
jgi:hypothetical protein